MSNWSVEPSGTFEELVLARWSAQDGLARLLPSSQYLFSNPYNLARRKHYHNARVFVNASVIDNLYKSQKTLKFHFLLTNEILPKPLRYTTLTFLFCFRYAKLLYYFLRNAKLTLALKDFSFRLKNFYRLVCR